MTKQYNTGQHLSITLTPGNGPLDVELRKKKTIACLTSQMRKFILPQVKFEGRSLKLEKQNG